MTYKTKWDSENTPVSNARQSPTQYQLETEPRTMAVSNGRLVAVSDDNEIEVKTLDGGARKTFSIPQTKDDEPAFSTNARTQQFIANGRRYFTTINEVKAFPDFPESTAVYSTVGVYQEVSSEDDEGTEPKSYFKFIGDFRVPYIVLPGELLKVLYDEGQGYLYTINHQDAHSLFSTRRTPPATEQCGSNLPRNARGRRGRPETFAISVFPPLSRSTRAKLGDGVLTHEAFDVYSPQSLIGIVNGNPVYTNRATWTITRTTLGRDFWGCRTGDRPDGIITGWVFSESIVVDATPRAGVYTDQFYSSVPRLSVKNSQPEEGFAGPLRGAPDQGTEEIYRRDIPRDATFEDQRNGEPFGDAVVNAGPVAPWERKTTFGTDVYTLTVQGNTATVLKGDDTFGTYTIHPDWVAKGMTLLPDSFTVGTNEAISITAHVPSLGYGAAEVSNDMFVFRQFLSSTAELQEIAAVASSEKNTKLHMLTKGDDRLYEYPGDVLEDFSLTEYTKTLSGTGTPSFQITDLLGYEVLNDGRQVAIDSDNIYVRSVDGSIMTIPNEITSIMGTTHDFSKSSGMSITETDNGVIVISTSTAVFSMLFLSDNTARFAFMETLPLPDTMISSLNALEAVGDKVFAYDGTNVVDFDVGSTLDTFEYSDSLKGDTIVTHQNNVESDEAVYPTNVTGWVRTLGENDCPSPKVPFEIRMNRPPTFTPDEGQYIGMGAANYEIKGKLLDENPSKCTISGREISGVGLSSTAIRVGRPSALRSRYTAVLTDEFGLNSIFRIIVTNVAPTGTFSKYVKTTDADSGVLGTITDESPSTCKIVSGGTSSAGTLTNGVLTMNKPTAGWKLTNTINVQDEYGLSGLVTLNIPNEPPNVFTDITPLGFGAVPITFKVLDENPPLCKLSSSGFTFSTPMEDGTTTVTKDSGLAWVRNETFVMRMVDEYMATVDKTMRVGNSTAPGGPIYDRDAMFRSQTQTSTGLRYRLNLAWRDGDAVTPRSQLVFGIVDASPSGTLSRFSVSSNNVFLDIDTRGLTARRVFFIMSCTDGDGNTSYAWDVIERM